MATEETAGRAAISVQRVGKIYRRTSALHDLTLQVQPGEVFGFLGPNGAGKTTAMKILVGLVRPTTGAAFLFGLPAARPRARAGVGYLPEHVRFPAWLTGEGVLDLHGRLAGLDRHARRASTRDVLERVGLAERGHERVRSYSKGMTQRLGLAQALLGEPRLVLLDEPTSALDPVGRRAVREVIRGLRDAGTTVLLNSHLLSEVEMVCDQVAIIDRGRVVAAGGLDDLVAGQPRVRITLDRVDAAALAVIGRHAQVIAVDGPAVTATLSRPEDVPLVAEALVRSGYRLHALEPIRRSLEDVFVSLVGDGGAHVSGADRA